MARTFDPFRGMDRWFSTSLDAGERRDAHGPLPHRRAFTARIDLPGVDPASIDIDIEDRTLTIRAERKQLADADAQWLVRERPTGTFARQLTLGHGVALDRIEAEYSDGVLVLNIPVAEEAKPRKISVAHSGSRTQIEGEVAE